MGVEWKPARLARAVEWELIYPAQPQTPIGVVRRLLIHGRPAWRAVTWAPQSGDRQLIGYFQTGDDAAQAVWDRFVADNAAKHEVASRVHGTRERHPD